MKLKNIITAVLLSTFPVILFSQNKLTRQAAAKTALENNYGIKVAKNNIRVAANNTSREMNGYLPTLNLSAGPTGSFGGSTQKFNGALGEAKVSNAFSWNASATAAANYQLFNKTRDMNLAKLKEVLNLTDLQLRQAMELNLMQVYNSYYQVAKLVENGNAVAQSLGVSRRRLQRAEYRFEYGQGTGLDVLNARVDIQRDSVRLLNIRQQLANAKRNLNVVMGMPVGNDFAVDTAVVYSPVLSEQRLIADAKNNNVAILMADQNLAINEVDLQVIDAGRKPTVGASASYNYNYSDNANGSFIKTSTSNGLNVGLTANWNIFDGGRRKVQEQNTRIAIESQLVQKEQIEQELERDVRNTWENYQNALFVLEVEKNALATNRLNLERTQELFNNGQLTSVEFRQAQLNLLNAEVSFNNAKYDAKVVELELIWLSGGLLDGVD